MNYNEFGGGLSEALQAFGFDDDIFDAVTRRHLRTEDAITRTVLYSFTYDANGLLTQVTDRDGNITLIERLADGSPSAIVSPDGQRTSLGLDANGYLASISDPAGDTSHYTYDAGGLMISFTDARSGLYSFTYDSFGRLVNETKPEGNSWALNRTLNNDLSFLVDMSTALGRSSGYYVSTNVDGSELRKSTDPSGLQIIRDVKADRTSTTTYPDGTVVTGSEVPDPRWGDKLFLPGPGSVTTPGGLTLNMGINRSVTLTDPADPFSVASMTRTLTLNGRAYTSTFDAATRTTTSATPLGRQTTTTTDPLGHLVSLQVQGLDALNLSYDARGRLSSTTQGTGAGARTYNIAYDTSGNVASITDPLSRVVGFTYDAAGRVTRKTLADGRVIDIAYDANGNITSITPPARPAHTFSYNALDTRTAYTAPVVATAPNTTTYAYNLDNQLTLMTRPDSSTAGLTYDTGGRLSAITLSTGGQVSYAYDATTGNLSSITAPSGEALAFTYDGSLVTGETLSGVISGSVGLTYDNDFRVTSQTINGANAAAYSYDADGLLTGAGVLSMTRDAGTLVPQVTALP